MTWLLLCSMRSPSNVLQMTAGAVSSRFESFPTLHDDEDEETIGSKIKRFFLPTGPASSSSSSTAGSVAPSASTTLASIAEAAPSTAPTLPIPLQSNTKASATRQHSRNNSATQQQLAQLASTSPPIPPLAPTAGLALPPISSSTKPLPTTSSSRRPVRPTRLSGVSPSVRLTVANSERGDLIQSGSSRSIYGDSRYGSDVGGTSSGSPGAGDSFGAALANLSSIPGFPLGRDAVDDSKSVRSMSTVARPSASVAHVFRKLRGEVSRAGGGAAS